MARPSGIMQGEVSTIINRNVQKGTPKHRLGQLRQTTLQDGRQLLQWVRNGHTNPQVPPVPPKEERQQLTNVPLSQRLINNRLV